MFAFATSTKITFVDFDGTHKGGTILQVLRNKLPQTMVEKTRWVAMKAD